MGVGKEKRSPLGIIVESWGFHTTPSRLLARQLDRLVHSGVHRVISLVPWQGVESDVSHRLSKFLQLAHAKKIAVTLVVTPEVGQNYAYSGLPAELSTKGEHQALHAGGRVAIVGLAPRSFALPSLSAGELSRRYASFLGRLDSVFRDLSRSHPEVFASVRLIASGSFWKYYRDPRDACISPFSGSAGDYSMASLQLYARKLDEHYSSAEFASDLSAGPGGATARWKSASLDDLNRRWFFQEAEDHYRQSTVSQLKKRFATIPLAEAEILTPEADPSVAYAQFMSRTLGAAPDARPYSRLVEEFSERRAQASGDGVASPVVQWCGLGGYERLRPAEKSFLLLKSLLLAGCRGGATWIPAEAWLGLGRAFRERLSTLSEAIRSGELSAPAARAVYWVPHLWSKTGRLWGEFADQAGACGIVSAAPIEKLLGDTALGLVMVDPARIIRRAEMRALIAAAHEGRIVVLPKSPLWSTDAKRELEAGVAQGQAEELTELLPFAANVPTLSLRIGKGWLIAHELPKDAAAESRSDWRNLAEGLARFAHLTPPCRVSDPRVKPIVLRRPGGELALFLLNESSAPVIADLAFPVDVALSDLSENLVRKAAVGDRARSFRLQVPAWGMLPLAVDAQGLGLTTSGSAMDREEAVLASRLEVEDFTWNV